MTHIHCQDVMQLHVQCACRYCRVQRDNKQTTRVLEQAFAHLGPSSAHLVQRYMHEVLFDHEFAHDTTDDLRDALRDPSVPLDHEVAAEEVAMEVDDLQPEIAAAFERAAALQSARDSSSDAMAGPKHGSESEHAQEAHPHAGGRPCTDALSTQEAVPIVRGVAAMASSAAAPVASSAVAGLATEVASGASGSVASGGSAAAGVQSHRLADLDYAGYSERGADGAPGMHGSPLSNGSSPQPEQSLQRASVGTAARAAQTEFAQACKAHHVAGSPGSQQVEPSPDAQDSFEQLKQAVQRSEQYAEYVSSSHQRSQSEAAGAVSATEAATHAKADRQPSADAHANLSSAFAACAADAARASSPREVQGQGASHDSAAVRARQQHTDYGVLHEESTDGEAEEDTVAVKERSRSVAQALTACAAQGTAGVSTKKPKL